MELTRDQKIMCEARNKLAGIDSMIWRYTNGLGDICGKDEANERLQAKTREIADMLSDHFGLPRQVRLGDIEEIKARLEERKKKAVKVLVERGFTLFYKGSCHYALCLCGYQVRIDWYDKDFEKLHECDFTKKAVEKLAGVTG